MSGTHPALALGIAVLICVLTWAIMSQVVGKEAITANVAAQASQGTPIEGVAGVADNALQTKGEIEGGIGKSILNFFTNHPLAFIITCLGIGAVIWVVKK